MRYRGVKTPRFHLSALLAEFKTKFPDWPNLNAVPNVVRHVYSENP
jgi:hypothetical protein